jgi:hypothetical protein
MKIVNQIKKIEASITFINKLNKSKKIVLKKANSIELNAPASMIKKNHEFLVSSLRIGEGDIFYPRKKIKTVEALWANRELVFEMLFVNRLTGVGFEVQVGIIRDKKFSDKNKQYQRLIIPCEKEISFFNIIEEKIYETKSFRNRGCVSTNFKNFSLDIYCYTELKDTLFLVIDCSSKISHNEFSDAAFASLVTLGYLTGKLVQNEGFYFTYPDIEMEVPAYFKFISLRPSINSIFHPVNSNPYSFGQKGKKGDALYKKLKPISTFEFSNLCQLVLQKHDLRAALLLMMEVLKGSIFTMATGMVVILETLTHIYSESIPKTSNRFKEPKLSSTILNKLRFVISEHSEELGDAEKKFLKKIDQLNQVPNTTKLSKTFEDLGFTLNEEDKKVIARRNDLLHGRLTLDYGDDFDSADREMYLIATKIYTLVNILILKQVEYSGYMVNWPVYNKHVHKIKLNENVFRKI